MEQGEELRHNILHLVRHKHLVAIELNLVAVQVEVALNLGEVEHTREVEGIVHVEMNPEEGLVRHGIEFAIERLVVLLLEVLRLLGPERIGVVDDVVLVGVLLLAVLPFGLFAKDNIDGKETAIFLQQVADAVFLQEFLGFVVNMEDDVGTAVGLLALADFVGRTAVAHPAHGSGILAITAGDDFHFLGHHKGAVEAQTEMADDGVGILLVFLEEVVGAREGNLVDILVNLLGGHTDAAVADGQRASVLVHFNLYLEFAHFAGKFTLGGQRLEFLRGIYGVADEFAQEDVVVTVKKFLDDRKDVFGRNSDITFLHDDIVF